MPTLNKYISVFPLLLDCGNQFILGMKKRVKNMGEIKLLANQRQKALKT